MEMEKFDQLEQRIKILMDLIDKIKQENIQVTNSYNGLASKVFDYEKKIKILTEENEQLKKDVKDVENRFKEKERKIKERMDNLLSRLETVKDLG
ncbi:MAG: hypothetical protein AMJ90_03340 [candidate division Zixibacteria bacterium SM23_73_2]|nr:MAG: hypothetical protein AMJ90_03340 [candidate division Zixibacteria bacterium SM23_73_2]